MDLPTGLLLSAWVTLGCDLWHSCNLQEGCCVGLAETLDLVSCGSYHAKLKPSWLKQATVRRYTCDCAAVCPSDLCVVLGSLRSQCPREFIQLRRSLSLTLTPLHLLPLDTSSLL